MRLPIEGCRCRCVRRNLKGEAIPGPPAPEAVAVSALLSLSTTANVGRVALVAITPVPAAGPILLAAGVAALLLPPRKMQKRVFLCQKWGMWQTDGCCTNNLQTKERRRRTTRASPPHGWTLMSDKAGLVALMNVPIEMADTSYGRFLATQKRDAKRAFQHMSPAEREALLRRLMEINAADAKDGQSPPTNPTPV